MSECSIRTKVQIIYTRINYTAVIYLSNNYRTPSAKTDVNLFDTRFLLSKTWHSLVKILKKKLHIFKIIFITNVNGFQTTLKIYTYKYVPSVVTGHPM